MPKAPNASQRQEVLRELNEIRKQTAWLRKTWDVRGTVYLTQEEREPGSNAYYRDRLPHEYPEEQPESWAHVYNVADEIIERATALRDLADKRYGETGGHYRTGSDAQ